VTYERDGHRCVSCGTLENLQYQHRAAVGMGGSDRAPRFPEGVTSCAVCNPAYEAHRQVEALFRGWKVRRWVAEQDLVAQVPVFFLFDGWHLLNADATRTAVSVRAAEFRMRAVYGPEWDDWRAAA
jgi:hypothetical protein